jgi:hypothetical protein
MPQQPGREGVAQLGQVVCDQQVQVDRLRRDGQPAADARDGEVEQVGDQPVGTAGRVGDAAQHLVLLGRQVAAREQVSAGLDGGERVAQVVADDADHLLGEQGAVFGGGAQAGRIGHVLQRADEGDQAAIGPEEALARGADDALHAIEPLQPVGALVHRARHAHRELEGLRFVLAVVRMDAADELVVVDALTRGQAQQARHAVFVLALAGGRVHAPHIELRQVEREPQARLGDGERVLRLLLVGKQGLGVLACRRISLS